ncbi:Kelch repeat-containing protein [Paenibacillus septentrionalis]|uniref:Kelch repeat-containing protein n=1 Tax=Paenibacillus septentrionalis TaxID=429342 RepID=A0ABW1V9I9_9BACL
MAKTNWQMDDTVMPDDLNQIGHEINELKADGSVTTTKLANKAVTAAKLADQAVGSNQLANAAVGTDKLAGQAVTTDKIANKAITKAKLADDVTIGGADDTMIGDRTISDTAAPTSSTGKLTSLLGGAAHMIKSITGGANWREVPGITLAAIKTVLDAATSAATGNVLIKRDANGRAKVAAPSASDDIARKAEVDAAVSAAASDASSKANAVQANLSEHTSDNVRHITAAERTAWNAKASTSVATSSTSGLMSASDKGKLDGIAAGAQVNTVNSVAGKTGAVTLAKGDVGLGNVDNVQQAPISHVGAGGTAHAAATTSTAGFMSAADKSKLDSIASGANNYVHPSTHPPSIISQDASNRFVTDAEKAAWNAKAGTAVATTSANGLMSAAMVTKLNGIAAGAQVNRSQATQAQAIAGTDNTTDMTPLRVREAIDARTRYGTTAGSATAFTLTLSPAPASLYTGLQITVKLHTNTGTNPTLNVNGLGARALYDSDGARFSGESGKIYTFVYDGTNFILRSGGGGGKLNVYTGLTQPAKKEGVWIQTSQAITSVRNDLDIWLANAWSRVSYADMPERISRAAAVSDGANTYVLGGFSSNSATSRSTNYRYNANTNTWTTLQPMVANVMLHCAAVVDKKIYVFGGSHSSNSTPTAFLRKYDILQNTWETLPNMPVPLQYAACVAVGTKIYIFGGSQTSFTDGRTTTRCYDTVSDTWSLLAAIPEQRASAVACAVGTKIYLVHGHMSAGTSGGNPKDFCYDTITNAWTEIATSPAWIRTDGSGVAVGNNVFVFYRTEGVVYNTTTNTWTVLPNGSVNHLYPVTGYYQGMIYVIGGNSLSSVSSYALNSTSYPTGTVILYRIDPAYGQWQTELVTPGQLLLGVNTRLLSHFDDAFIHDGTTLRGDLPSYYGNGSAWVKFKN